MTLRKKIAIALATALFLAGILFAGYRFLEVKFVEVHQRSVTRSIAEWGDEYSQIQTEKDAVRAVEMMEYISRYYVPGEGYRSTHQVEEGLQSRRARTMKQIGEALEAFTGERNGTNVAEWITWKNKTQAAMERKAR